MKKKNRRQFLKESVKSAIYTGGLISGIAAINSCEQETFGYYTVDSAKCTGTKSCISSCKYGAISFSNNKANINASRCAACSHCLPYCPSDAIYFVGS